MDPDSSQIDLSFAHLCCSHNQYVMLSFTFTELTCFLILLKSSVCSIDGEQTGNKQE